MIRSRYFILIGILLLGVAAMATDFNQRMVMINNHPMISLRDFAETLDATVDYDINREEISISIDDTTVFLRPYSTTAYINDRKVWLDEPVVIMDDVTYLPLRFMCDAFDLDSDWAGDNRQVVVVNRWTLERIVLIIDLDWGRRPHYCRRDYDYHTYVGFHTRHRDYRGYRHDNHGGSYGRYDHPAGPPRRDDDRRNDGDHRYGGNDGRPTGGTDNHGGYGRPNGETNHGGVDRPNGGGQHGSSTTGGRDQRGTNDRPEANNQPRVIRFPTQRMTERFGTGRVVNNDQRGTTNNANPRGSNGRPAGDSQYGTGTRPNGGMNTRNDNRPSGGFRGTTPQTSGARSDNGNQRGGNGRHGQDNKENKDNKDRSNGREHQRR